MTGARDRDTPASSSSGEPRQREESIESAERFGPLTVSRHVKDDGRALILFTLREHPELGERADEPGAHSDEPGERPA